MCFIPARNAEKIASRSYCPGVWAYLLLYNSTSLCAAVAGSYPARARYSLYANDKLYAIFCSAVQMLLSTPFILWYFILDPFPAFAVSVAPVGSSNAFLGAFPTCTAFCITVQRLRLKGLFLPAATGFILLQAFLISQPVRRCLQSFWGLRSVRPFS